MKPTAFKSQKLIAAICLLAIGLSQNIFASLVPLRSTETDSAYVNSPYAPRTKVEADYITAHDADHYYALYLTGGVMISNIANNTDVVMDHYGTVNSYDTQTKWTGLLGLGFGMGFINYPYPFHNFSVTVDPAFYYADFGTINGIEHPDSSGGDFDPLNYQFEASSYSLMLESHLAYTAYAWQPVFTIGIGPSFNNLNNYSEVAVDPDGSAAPALSVFTNNIEAAFAYEVGVGIQRVLYVGNRNQTSYNLDLDYRYFNFGSGELGQSAVQGGSDHLQVSSLGAQAILLSLNMTFN